jgi:hypothetical protein
MRARVPHRHRLQILFLAVTVLACGRDEPAPAPRRAAVVDVARIPVPDHGPEVMAGNREMRRTKSTEGVIEAMIDGDHVQHGFLPYGMNAAIASEETGVARLILAGSPTDAGYPALHLRFEGLRLDQVDLPKTFTNRNAPGKPGRGPKVVFPKVEYHETEQIVFEAEPEREDAFEVTLESFEGDTVRGTFEATLHPRVQHFGAPKRIERGRFEVMVRRSGIEPGRSPSADDPSLSSR